MRARMGGLVVLVAVALAALACSGDAEEGGAAGQEREPAPDFTLPVLDGGTLSLEDLRGKTVVIDFWATWCPPCEYQVPELNAFYEAHKDADVAVIGISVDTEGPDVVSKWTQEKGVEYPILLGDEELARQFGALGFPTVVIVSPDGYIQARHMGLIERDELEDAFAESGEST